MITYWPLNNPYGSRFQGAAYDFGFDQGAKAEKVVPMVLKRELLGLIARSADITENEGYHAGRLAVRHYEAYGVKRWDLSRDGRDPRIAYQPESAIASEYRMNAAKWHKGVLEWHDGDTVCLSVVFTWHADEAYQRAVYWRTAGKRVRVGGPGVFVNHKEMATVAEVGGAIPDTVRRHNPMATFASRGCPVGCWFCIVPKMEGRDFTLIDDFPVRPILCDNNLSALPADFQDHIVARYRQAGVPLLDANSGYEPITFTDEVYRRWKPINRGPWRFAFDESAERDDVRRVCRMLNDVSPKRTRVYVLIGNEPIDSCMGRIREVIEWGGEPHVQPLMKLNARTKKPWVRYDWTADTLRRVARWANRRLWKYCTFANYDSSVRTRTSVPVDTAQGELWASR